MKTKLFEKKNFALFGIALAMLILGYVLLGVGSVDGPLSKSVAPVILVAVYCGLIPYSIVTGFKKSEKDSLKK